MITEPAEVAGQLHALDAEIRRLMRDAHKAFGYLVSAWNRHDDLERELDDRRRPPPPPRAAVLEQRRRETAAAITVHERTVTESVERCRDLQAAEARLEAELARTRRGRR